MKESQVKKAVSLSLLTLAALTMALAGCATPKAEAEGAEKALARVAAVGKTGEEAESLYNAMHTEGDSNAMVAAKRKITCDNIGKVIICTDGKSVCWWGPKNGYGCSF